MGIKTLEDAENLPERNSMSYTEEVDSKGRRVIIPHFKDIVAITLEDDDIFLFTDKDGRPMAIECDSEGFYKTPLRI